MVLLTGIKEIRNSLSSVRPGGFHEKTSYELVLKDGWITGRQRNKREPSGNQNAMNEGMKWKSSTVSAECTGGYGGCREIQRALKGRQGPKLEQQKTDAWKVFEPS